MAVTTADVMTYLPKGVILPFNGDPAACIPWGWAVCDGNNGTPDLTSSFLRGAADANEVGQTGGSESHAHVCENNGVHASNGWETNGSCEQGKTNSVSHLPPFYRVVFIMKVK